jgi:hypothetical protein
MSSVIMDEFQSSWWKVMINLVHEQSFEISYLLYGKS